MNAWTRITLLFGFILILCWGPFVRRKEMFVNAQNQLFSKNDLSKDSVNVDTPIKYKRAFYYEMDNAAFDKALQMTFAHDCAAAKAAFTEPESKWKMMNIIENGGKIEMLMGAMMDFLRKKLNTSAYMRLKNGTPSVIQVIHEQFVRGRAHTTKKWFEMEIEAILYRENTPHGKHVTWTMFVDESKKEREIVVIKQDLLGIVPADLIAMHPVMPTDFVEMDQMELSFDPNPLTPFPATLLDEKTINVVMEKQQKKQEADRNAAMAVERNRYENAL